MKITPVPKVLLLLLGVLLLMPTLAKATLELVGTPVKVSENRGRMAVDIDGKPFIAAFAYDHYQNGSRNSLLIINPLNGETQQYWVNIYLPNPAVYLVVSRKNVVKNNFREELT